MAFDVSIVLTWILFLALLPMAYFWLRRAWRILFRRDFSDVALKRGVAPPNAARFAPVVAAVNLVAGTVIACVVLMVLFWQIDYGTWTAIAGSTIWCKFFADFAISRHAHASAAREAATRRAP